MLNHDSENIKTSITLFGVLHRGVIKFGPALLVEIKEQGEWSMGRYEDSDNGEFKQIGFNPFAIFRGNKSKLQ